MVVCSWLLILLLDWFGLHQDLVNLSVPFAAAGVLLGNEEILRVKVNVQVLENDPVSCAVNSIAYHPSYLLPVQIMLYILSRISHRRFERGNRPIGLVPGI
uniref:Putative secreted peptide n=1 Tax=Anopheles braziliensis TaxID=58242 RepID=A0A2M3ZSJ4_9DIPT